MKRWVLLVLCGGALALASVALASAPSEQAWDISLFSVVPGSTATTGHVDDAPEYGGITVSGPVCCEITILFERHFDAATMDGRLSGTVIVGGNPDDTIWRGELRGRMTSAGSSGRLTLVERSADGLARTGRKLTGTWFSVGQPDQSVPHFITIHVDGKLSS